MAITATYRQVSKANNFKALQLKINYEATEMQLKRRENMGVYIPMMTLPVSCYSCEVYKAADCILWRGSKIDERHPNCPLVEVKEPHGRLVDVDAIDYRNDMMLNQPNTFVDGVAFMHNRIIDTPTVIEAEVE